MRTQMNFIMYLPSQFDEPNTEVMHELIRAKPLATLVVLTANGLDANHIPLHLSLDSSLGTLRGHVARSNPMWKEFRDNVEVLAIFHGPETYISPSWYATKSEHGKVVPTWNYVVAHAYGKLNIIHDASWIRTQLNFLTQQHEAFFDEPWKLADAPSDFTDNLIKAIVGVEIVITELKGKWKVSQNQPSKNQLSVVQGLSNNSDQNALEMAQLVKKAANCEE